MNRTGLELLDEYRREIDQLDVKILALLNERTAIVEKIGHVKNSLAMPVYEPRREDQVFGNVLRHNAGPLPADAVSDSSSASLTRCARCSMYGGGKASETPAANRPRHSSRWQNVEQPCVAQAVSPNTANFFQNPLIKFIRSGLACGRPGIRNCRRGVKPTPIANRAVRPMVERRQKPIEMFRLPPKRKVCGIGRFRLRAPQVIHNFVRSERQGGK